MSGLLNFRKKNKKKKEEPVEEEIYDDGDEDTQEIYELPEDHEEQNYEVPGIGGSENEEKDHPSPPTSPKPQLPPKPAGGEKGSKLNAPSHGISTGTIQAALVNLKNTGQFGQHSSEDEPTSPTNVTPTPETPTRPLPRPPPRGENRDVSDGSPCSDSSAPPVPVKRHVSAKDSVEGDDDDDDIYSDAVSERLSVYDWFHGDLSRHEGETRVLTVGKDGAFLIRKSHKRDNQPYTMVLLYAGRVNNLKIRRRNDGRFALGEEKANEIHFDDVPAMIDYHRKNPVSLTGKQQGDTTLKDSPNQ